MRLTRYVLILLCLFLATVSNAQDLLQFMEQQKDIKQIEEISGNPSFKHTYVIMLRQPLNYRDTTDGFFLQRVFVAEKQKAVPTILITEGYAANYAENPKYINELSEILDGNQICVEHRYFAQSTPDPLNWDYLTVENAANDHHRVVQLFKPFFAGKWLNTGISKGGQTALAHRTFFPNDVDLTVAYVAPLNFGVEDGRHEPFLKKVGTKACREEIQNIQIEVLKRRDPMRSLLKGYCEEKGYHSKFTFDQLLDMVVLEYPFAFWQWGAPQDQIPSLNASDKELFAYLTSISEPDYFTYEGGKLFLSFYYQAARELGYYGYDTKPFDKLLSMPNTQGYMNKYMVPDSVKVDYHPETALKIDHFLKNEARNVVLIYGETDPWSASAADLNNNPSNLKIMAPNGSHRIRIKSLNPKTKNDVIAFIRSALAD